MSHVCDKSFLSVMCVVSHSCQLNGYICVKCVTDQSCLTQGRFCHVAGGGGVIKDDEGGFKVWTMKVF